MTDGIAVELAIGAPGDCPVAAASEDTGKPIASVSRASGPDDSGHIAEEFSLPAGETASQDGVDKIAAIGSRDVFRFSREPGRGCVCETVERIAGPISDIRARDGTLYVSVNAPDLATIRETVTTLRDRFDGVRVRHLARRTDDAESDHVIVDRGRLTDRQLDVLRVAHEMGYFEHPKGANAGEVADALGITSSTFREHLAAAQGKFLDVILEGQAAIEG